VRCLRRWAEPAIALLVFAGALAWFERSLHLTFDVRDEGYLYYDIARVARGERLVAEVRDAYGPLLLAVHVPVYRASGGEILAVRRQLAVLRAGAVVAVYAIARHLVGRPHALFAALLGAAWFGRVLWNLNTPYAALYTTVVSLGALALALRGLARGSSGWLFAAGLASGLGVLFKQSLGLAVAYGLALALLASGLLREPPGAAARGRAAWLALLGLAGVAIAVPFASALGARDYLLHLLPLHLLLAVVAWRFARHGDPKGALRTAAPRLVAWGAGFLLPLAATAAWFARQGVLAELLDLMFVLPLRLQNYALPVALPTPGRAALLAAGLAASTAGLLALRGARAPALGAAAAAGLLGFAARGELRSLQHLLFAADAWGGVLIALVTTAGAALLALRLLRAGAPPAGPRTLATLAVLLFQATLAFQIFPRGGLNTVIALGALAPGMALLVERAGAAARRGAARSRLRAGLAFALAALVPAFLVSHLVVQVLSAPAPDELEESALRLPAARGIRVPAPEFRRDHLRAVEWLVDHLRTASPAGAPLLLVANEPMLFVLSERPSLVPEHALELFLIGWDLWPSGPRDTELERTLLGRLAAEPRALLVERDDVSSIRMRRRFPALDRVLESDYAVEYRVGPYRVLRRRPLGA
jgi:hypothetical protein